MDVEEVDGFIFVNEEFLVNLFLESLERLSNEVGFRVLEVDATRHERMLENPPALIDNADNSFLLIKTPHDHPL